VGVPLTRPAHRKLRPPAAACCSPVSARACSGSWKPPLRASRRNF